MLSRFYLSLYIAYSGQRDDIIFSSFLLHVLNHALKDMYMQIFAEKIYANDLYRFLHVKLLVEALKLKTLRFWSTFAHVTYII